MRLFGIIVLAICVGVAAPRAAAVPDAKPVGAGAALAANFPLSGNVTFVELLATIVDACPEVAGFYDSAAKGNFTSFLSMGILAFGHSFDLLEGAVLALASSDAAFAGAFAAGSVTAEQLADPTVAGELIVQQIGVAASSKANSAAISNLEPDTIDFFLSGEPISLSEIYAAAAAGNASAEIVGAATGQRARVLTVGGCPEVGVYIANVDTLLMPAKYIAAASVAGAPSIRLAAALALVLAAAAP
jgi:hypothetical protein